MHPERWRQIDELLEQALEARQEERPALLAAACDGDPNLLRAVERLLRAHEGARSFFEASALEVAAREMATEPTGTLVGRTVCHYEVISRLGAGGMGVVYLARDTSL